MKSVKSVKSEVDKFLEDADRVTSADISEAIAPLDKKNEFSRKRKFKGMTPLLTALFRYIIENIKLHMWSPSQEIYNVSVIGSMFENKIVTAKEGRKLIRKMNGDGVERSMTPLQYLIWWYITLDFTT